jgi:hypothetical protein
MSHAWKDDPVVVSHCAQAGVGDSGAAAAGITAGAVVSAAAGVTAGAVVPAAAGVLSDGVSLGTVTVFDFDVNAPAPPVSPKASIMGAT